jgi:hypothetical protein
LTGFDFFSILSVNSTWAITVLVCAFLPVLVPVATDHVHVACSPGRHEGFLWHMIEQKRRKVHIGVSMEIAEAL